jgi:hypothetical protein
LSIGGQGGLSVCFLRGPSLDERLEPRITAIMAGRLIVNVLGASWAPEGAMRRRLRGTKNMAD